jgi:propanediol utilization protein
MLRRNLRRSRDRDMMVRYKNQSRQQIGGFMTIAKNHPTSQPLVIDVSNTDIHLSPARLDRLQSDNPDLQLELTEDGKLVVIPVEVAGNRQAESEVEQGNTPASNSTSKGTSNLVEMTPEETAIRVATFDRFIEYKRQLWESLTPEEKIESDRQFENLAKLLEESRR